MAAGKSTHAIQLSSDKNITVFCEDDMLAKLYPGDIVDINTYVKCSQRLKSAVEKPVIKLLSCGTSLLMDFPANTIAQRAWLVGLAIRAGASHELHYIEVTNSKCKARLLNRAKENPERAATDTIEMFDAVNPYFEPPADAEALNVVLIKDRGN